MIKLFVEDYCHNCTDFDPYVNKSNFECDMGRYLTDTDITCKHAERCEEIKTYLEKEIKNERK